MKFSAVSAAALLAGSANAFWRMECRAQVTVARLDPLVDFAKVGKHAHTVHGSSGFSATSNSDDLVNGDCTSCAVVEDKSAYWTPTLHFKNAATGKFELVQQVGGMLAYYFLNYDPNSDKIHPFPHGFEMIAGDTNRRSFSLPIPDPPKAFWAHDPNQSSQAGLAQKAVGFNCLNYAGEPEGSLYRHSLPNKAYLDANCKSGIRAELMFPSCWNGKDLTSADKMSHVAYPSTVMDGACPKDFPIRLPGLFFETIWNTAAYAGIDGEFVFSNGDATGNGYHGDFIMGWEEGVLEAAVETCTSNSGRIQDCPVFTIQRDEVAELCKMKKSILSSILSIDDILGPALTLPGGVRITGDHESAGSDGSFAPPAPIESVVPVPPPSASSAAQPSKSILPGDAIQGEAAAAANIVEPVIVSEPPVTTPAPTVPLADNQKLSTTKYLTEGGSVIELIVIEEFTTVTDKPEIKTEIVNVRKRHTHRHGRHA